MSVSKDVRQRTDDMVYQRYRFVALLAATVVVGAAALVARLALGLW